jgi:hypothetical protein
MALMLDANFFIAVIVAAIVSFVIGGIWYGAIFGKMWMAALGRTQADMEAMRKKAPMRAPIGYASAFVGSLIAAGVLATFLSWAGSATPGIGGGLLAGFLVWLGFIATSVGPSVLFEGRSAKVAGINAAFAFVSYLVMGAIIKIWVAP